MDTLLPPDPLTVLPLASSRSQDSFTAPLVLRQTENTAATGNLTKAEWSGLLPLGELFQASRGTGAHKRGRRHSDLLVPFDTAFLAFLIFCSDLGLVRGRSPPLPLL